MHTACPYPKTLACAFFPVNSTLSYRRCHPETYSNMVKLKAKEAQVCQCLKEEAGHQLSLGNSLAIFTKQKLNWRPIPS